MAAATNGPDLHDRFGGALASNVDDLRGHFGGPAGLVK
jgi:hypothetical protein